MADSISGLSIDGVGGAYSKYSNTTVDTDAGDSASSYMDFDSYLKVLAAQMSNQDFNDPMSDSEMLQQMASYSMLEGIKNMTQQSNISYASSLVGKAVTVSDNGTYDTGLVDSVVVESGKAYLMVNGFLYDASTVSNIADADIYNKLSLLIGRDVNIKTDTEGVYKSGTVTNVLILSGKGYVVVDGDNMYSLSDISLKPSEESSGGENDKDESTEGSDSDSTVSGAEGDTSESTAETMTLYNNAQENTEAAGYQAYSDALFDELMSTIDSISGSETATETETPIVPDISGYETVTVKYVDTPDYAAGVFADDDEILEVLSAVPTADVNTKSDTSSSSYSSTVNRTLRSGVYDRTLTTSNLASVASTARNGRISSYLTNDEVRNILTDSSYNTRYSTRYGLEVQSDTKPGISTSDCEPHRLDADKYPEEAALADALGTRMYDIKYINNHAITSRINTSTVIGRTISGREITEIGYSGVGRLGEVVTFKDGTQRVEIISDDGTSSWLTTSGKYTLDEICDFNCAPGSLTGKLTPFELAIRNYARQKTASEYAIMTSFKSQLISMGVTVSTV
ncbi:MAG: hypothetical protein MRZ61_11045 [Oscillospiraceae bacterium]|nr:hypothetical protein [Oscillospiraceae bacterium]